MITILQSGNYRLIETWGGTRVLYLDDNSYVWLRATGVGEMLVMSHKPHHTDYTLALGRYRLYELEDEPKYLDGQYLELLVGDGTWQGYVLKGLPNDDKKRVKITPVREVLSARMRTREENHHGKT